MSPGLIIIGDVIDLGDDRSYHDDDDDNLTAFESFHHRASHPQATNGKDADSEKSKE